MTKLLHLNRLDTAPEVTRPDPARRIAGEPVHTTWNLEARGTLYAGLWHSTPGAWRIAYDAWEYFHIHEGVSVLTDAEGVETTLRAGDSFVTRPGFTGSWQVIEATLKDYVSQT